MEQKNIDDLVRDLNYLRNINKVILEKFLTGICKGSFNINAASKEIYEYLKLKKYMTMIKCLMQDVLHNLAIKSMNNFIKFFQRFIPMKTEFKNVNEVINTYEPEEVVEEINTTKIITR